MKLTSSRVTNNSSSGETSCSVVPTSKRPPHGTANSTRPSSVFGMSIASCVGNFSIGNRMCEPLLSRIGEGTGRVHDHFRVHIERPTATDLILHRHAGEFPSGRVAKQRGDARIVQRRAAGLHKTQ